VFVHLSKKKNTRWPLDCVRWTSYFQVHRLVRSVTSDHTNVILSSGKMRIFLAICILLMLGWQHGGEVRADSDSDSDSDSSSGEHKKHKGKKHKYNNPAYPEPYGQPYPYPYPYPYNPYAYNQVMPQYPAYAPYPYNPYMQAPPPMPPMPGQPGAYPSNPGQPGGYPAANPGQPAGYPPAPAAGQYPSPNWNPNASAQPQQPQQPSSAPGLPTPYPQPGSSVINHSLKVNKEYNEDGHHSSP
ncbi:hypothetical protein KR018_012655, partial [Drosophila ironensis]